MAARGMRAMTASIFLHMLFSMSYLFYTTRAISFEDFQFVLTAATSIQLLLYSVVFLNYSTQPTSFLVKLVGISLVTILVALGLVYRSAYADHRAAFLDQLRVELAPVERALIEGHPLPAHRAAYVLASAREGSVEGAAVLRDVRHPSLPAERHAGLHRTICAAGQPSGRIEFRALDRTAPETYFLAMCVMTDAQIFEIGVPYLRFRESMHRIVARQMWISFGAAAGMIVVFPFFFFAGLVRPLMALVEGARKVNRGAYDVRLPVQIPDEIGFLTRTFNQMVHSVKDSRAALQKHAENLELRVRERTEDLNNSLERIRRLKEKQDGDYLLSSLLLNPLSQNLASSPTVQVESFSRQLKQFRFQRWEAEIGGDMNMSRSVTLCGRPCTIVMNGDAMGKSIQGAGGALVLGAVFEALLKRTVRTEQMQEHTPERWLRAAFAELQGVFESFDCRMLVSAIVAVVDERSGAVFYAVAEHPYPALYFRGQARLLIPRHRAYKFGIPFKQKGLHINVYRLRPGESMILGSDGRHDLGVTQANGEIGIVENEDAFLAAIVEGGGELDRIYLATSARGAILDDFSLMRIVYRPQKTDSPALVEDYREAVSAYREGELQQAAHAARNLAVRSSSELLKERALKLAFLCARKLEDADFALQLANAYVDLNPGDSMAMAWLAERLLSAGFEVEGAALAERVLARQPQRSGLRQRLVEFYQQNGNHRRAQALQEEFTEWKQNAGKWADR